MKTIKTRKVRLPSRGFTFAALVVDNATRIEERKAKKKEKKCI